jgi:hypothetical protein
MESMGTQWRFREGDTVYGSDGHKLGKVVGFFPDYTNQQFLIVEKGFIFSHDYYVPLSAVSNYDGNEIYLDVSKDEALNRGWEQTPFVSSTVETDTSMGS